MYPLERFYAFFETVESGQEMGGGGCTKGVGEPREPTSPKACRR